MAGSVESKSRALIFFGSRKAASPQPWAVPRALRLKSLFKFK